MKAMNPKENEELLPGEGCKQPTVSHTFQRGQFYRTVEDFNKQAKYGEDACAKLLECLANLPQRCLTPCTMFSLCLSMIVLLLYLGGIIWVSTYNIYDIKYIDDDNKQQSTSIILQCDESAVLTNEYICEYYGFQSCVASDSVSTSSLTEFDSTSMIFIKIQLFVAWAMWCRLRFVLKDMSIFSITYMFLVIFCNVISYIFRHLGWIYYSKSCKILYSPYFSTDFVHAIISFIVSFLFWIILVGICLKRVEIGRNGDTKLVFRWKGNVVDRNQGIVDNCSAVANILIWLFFAYAAGGSSLWIGIENYANQVQRFVFDDTNTDLSQYTSWINLIEWFGTTVVQYFVPKIQWISIYVFASMATNLLFVVDICIFILKLIRDLVEKARKKRRERQQMHQNNNNYNQQQQHEKALQVVYYIDNDLLS